MVPELHTRAKAIPDRRPADLQPEEERNRILTTIPLIPPPVTVIQGKLLAVKTGKAKSARIDLADLQMMKITCREEATADRAANLAVAVSAMDEDQETPMEKDEAKVFPGKTVPLKRLPRVILQKNSCLP